MSERYDKHRRIVRQRTIMAVCVILFVGTLLIAGIAFVPRAVDAIKDSFKENTAETEVAEEPETVEEVLPVAPETFEEPDVDELMNRAEEVINTDEAEEVDTQIQDKISVMTNAQRIAQLFFVTPETLTGVDAATAAGEATRAALSENQIGGLIYFSKNILDPAQLKEMLYNTQSYALSENSLPLFLGVDEEGTSVSRIASNEAFGEELPEETGRTISGGLSPEGVYNVGNNIGKYLKNYGFNLDFAPVADVSSGDNSVMKNRSFGSDADYVSDMAVNFSLGLKDAGVFACYKHFPGFGRAEANTDFESISINAISEEIKSIDAKPFIAGIENGVNFIMITNAGYPDIDGSGVPACMSELIVTDYLKNELGFKGIVITDALNAKAIADKYMSGEAAVAAFKAGCDMLLMPADYEEAYEAVLRAYESGDISNERLEDALTRILTVKKELNADIVPETDQTDADDGEQEEEVE